MTQAKGIMGQLLGGVKEAVYKTTPGTVSAVVLPFISSGIKSDQPLTQSKIIRGRRDAAKPSLGNITVSGPVEVPLDLENIGYWLQMAMGDPSTTGTGPYVHEFTVGDSLDSWVLEQGFTDINQYQEFNGCKCNSLAFSFNAGANDELTVNAQIEGATETLGTSSIDASPTEHALTKLTIGDLSLTEGGSSIASVTQVDFTLGNNLDTSQYVVGGGGVRGALPEGDCVATGTLTALFENQTLLNKAVNGTESSLVMTLTSGSYSLVLELNELMYSRSTPGINGPQGILQSLPFTAYYDDHGDNSIVVATLTNTTDSYPA